MMILQIRNKDNTQSNEVIENRSRSAAAIVSDTKSDDQTKYISKSNEGTGNQSKAGLPGCIDPAPPVVSLKKNISFISCLGILVGTIIGSGIFVSPQGVLIGTGSIGLSLVVWVLCGFLTLIGSMVYAELGLMLPSSGGNYIYLMAAYGQKKTETKHSWGSLIPFLHFWQTSLFIKPASTTLQGMATSHYVMQLASIGGCGSLITNDNSALLSQLITAFFILTITALNSHSNKLSTCIINVLTLSKLVAVAFIIIVGCVKLSQGMNEALYTGFEGTTFSGIAGAYFSGCWAYSGWEYLNLVTKELVNPKRDLLRSLIVTCIIVTSVYLLVNVSYFVVLPKESFLASEAVVVTFAELVAGKAGVIFVIASVALSIFGSSFSESFTGNRIVYAAAREGHMIELFSFIHFRRMTPLAAIYLNGCIALMLVPFSSVSGLISLTGFLVVIFHFLTTLSLLVLRKKMTRKEDDFQVPYVFIVISLAISLLFSVEPFITDPKIELFYVVAFLLLGIPVFVLFVRCKKTLPMLDSVTSLLQKLLLIVPPDDEEDEGQ